MGCCWSAAGTSGALEGKRRTKWFVIDHDTVANSLKFEITRAGYTLYAKGAGCRVVLLDGTIVKEWGNREPRGSPIRVCIIAARQTRKNFCRNALTALSRRCAVRNVARLLSFG